MASSTATRVVEEYKDSNTFVVETTLAVASIYVVGFDDYKAKVAKTYPNTHRTTPIDRVEEEDELIEEG